jgi:hypothetical protein
VNGIKSAGLLSCQAGPFHCADGKSGLYNLIKDATGVSFGGGIGLNHGKSSVAHKGGFGLQR